jgi:hypothetical protein
MSPSYEFTNPVDLMAMRFDTLEEAEEKARTYLGRENAFAEDCLAIDIRETRIIKTVTRIVKTLTAPLPPETAKID